MVKLPITTEANFHIVLIEPEIPQNTGNIGRTCVGTACDLHLVGKLGFEITDKNLKRAGLDYWVHLNWQHHLSLDVWQNQIADSQRVFYFSTKAQQSYFDVKYHSGDWLVFGRETKGLDPDLLQSIPKNQLVKIPQYGPIRSLNVATAAAIAIYEGLRQLGASCEPSANLKTPT